MSHTEAIALAVAPLLYLTRARLLGARAHLRGPDACDAGHEGGEEGGEVAVVCGGKGLKGGLDAVVPVTDDDLYW